MHINKYQLKNISEASFISVFLAHVQDSHGGNQQQGQV